MGNQAKGMTRRGFNVRFAALLATALNFRYAFAETAAPSPRRVLPRRSLKPAALKRGDLVALFNPSGFADDALIQRATGNLEKLGFRVMQSAHIRASRGNTARRGQT